MNEKIIHLKEMGKTVAKTRIALNMSQIEFYQYLFPNSNKEDDVVKKKMNSIENGKSKNIDLEFLNTFASRFNYGLDYIFGLQKDFKNYTNEYLCKYFGLNENTIIALHKIGQDKNIDLNEAMTCSNKAEEYNIHKLKAQQHMDKDFAYVFTNLLDYLFLEENIPEEKYLSKLSIFYFIYNYLTCDAKLKNEKFFNFNYENKTNDNTYMIDSDNRVYGVDPNDIYLEIISKKLLKALDEIRDRYHTSSLQVHKVPSNIHYSVKRI